MSAERELEASLLEAYERAKNEEKIFSPRFKPMLQRQGVLEATKRLLKPSRALPDGFRRLIDAGRPDLTLESIVLQRRFRHLFTREELAEARGRLGLTGIVQEINDGAVGRPIGNMQKQRSERHNLVRVPNLFDGRTINADDGYAYHVGGLAELQFNIGFEKVDGKDVFRHGVAFSLQPTRNVPDIRVLIPRIEKFNEFIRTYPDAFDDLTMWHWANGKRSDNYAPTVIPDRLARENSFVFLGALQPAADISIDSILDDFDRLLPLYDYVEGTQAFPTLVEEHRSFEWSPGNKARAPRTTYSRKEKTVDKALRHNILQDALFKHLESLNGKDDTSGEQNCGNGTPVDVAVRDGDRYTYYEIKTGLSARSCIREALGQLMEYSFWPGAQEAEKLIIVGEPPLDEEAAQYLASIRKRFSLPIYYQRFDVEQGVLIT